MASEIERNPIYLALETAQKTIRGMFEVGQPIGVVFTGPPGLGKSFLVQRLCRLYHRPWDPLRPSASKLLHEIYSRRHKGGLLLFDEYDDVFAHRSLLEILMIVLDSSEDRILSHGVHGKMALPPFKVYSNTIFLSNKDFYDPKQFSDAIFRSHIPAFISRVTIITLPFDADAVYEYTLFLAPRILGNLRPTDQHGKTRFLDKPKRAEIIDHLEKNRDRYREISPRIIHKIGMLRLAHLYDDVQFGNVREMQLTQPKATRQTVQIPVGPAAALVAPPQRHAVDEYMTDLPVAEAVFATASRVIENEARQQSPSCLSPHHRPGVPHDDYHPLNG